MRGGTTRSGSPFHTTRQLLHSHRGRRPPFSVIFSLTSDSRCLSLSVCRSFSCLLPTCPGVTSASSLQDVVNVVGGVGVLLPLLEQMCEAEPVLNGGQEISDLLGPELTSSRGPAAMLLPLNKSSGEDRLSSSRLRRASVSPNV